MKLILKENVIGLGYKDDVVTVKDGYGRNYLIPTGKAVISSKSALKVLEEELKQRAHKLAKIKAEAEALAERLQAIRPIVIETKVSATGSIYGSVNNLHIADALKEQGFEIDRKTIVLKDVKEVGEYVATVKIYKGVSAEVPFVVKAEGAPVKQEKTVTEEAAPAVEEVAPVVEDVVVEAPAAEETSVEEEAATAEPQEENLTEE